MGYFKLKSKINLEEINQDTILQESDYATITPEGNFVQLEYFKSNEAQQKFKLTHGSFQFCHSPSNELDLKPISFSNDAILEKFISTKEISDKINHFFNKIPVYAEMGIEIPTRKILLYGPAGTGKTTSINACCRSFMNDKETAIIIWHTSKFKPYDVKDFLSNIEYVGVKRLIFIAEDVGGTSHDDYRENSDPSLLALLDNNERSFLIPTLCLFTTNYANKFMENIGNRPGRIDDKVFVGRPVAEQRFQLLKFYGKDFVTSDNFEMIKDKKFDCLTPAHIKDVVLRHRIYDVSIESAMLDILKEIQNYNKGFVPSKKAGMGLLDEE